MFDYATTDLTLAIAHHLLVFALAGVIAFEIASVRTGIAKDAILRVASVDLWYGILAGAIVVVGILRLRYAAKGWAYYSVNPYFWAKMGAFVIVALLSIIPTIVFLRWRRAAADNPAFVPPAVEVARVRRYFWLEVGFFALIPVFAAAMARMQ